MGRPVLSEEISQTLLSLLKQYVEHHQMAGRCPHMFTGEEIVAAMYELVLAGALRVDVFKNEAGDIRCFRVVTTEHGAALTDFLTAPVQGHA